MVVITEEWKITVSYRTASEISLRVLPLIPRLLLKELKQENQILLKHSSFGRGLDEDGARNEVLSNLHIVEYGYSNSLYHEF
jgi:hypothetical protein